MSKVFAFFIREKLLIKVLIAVILLSGLVAIRAINREAFPNVNLDMVVIKTIYKGAAPDDVEQLISLPIEKKLREVNGIDKLRAYNIENASVVVCFLLPETRNKDKVVQDIKDAVERVTNLPAAADKPTVEQITSEKTPALSIALCLPTDGPVTDAQYRELRAAAKDLEDSLYDEIVGISTIEKFGWRDREYLVAVAPEKMSAYRVGMNTLMYRIKSRNLDLPGGPLRIGDQEFVLRTKGQYRSAQDVAGTVLLANDVGYITRISDVGTVADSFEEYKIKERINGKPAIVLKIWKKDTADTIVITDAIKKLLKDYKLETQLPLETVVFGDYSVLVRARLASLIVNALTGFLLLALVLVLVLGIRMAAIVGLSVPVTFMTAFLAMKYAGITLNIVSMFALVMVLGMVVDFAIVVAENTYRHLEEGMPRSQAVLNGVSEIVAPLTITMLCMSVAFAPLFFMTGLIGKFVKVIPFVIISCLVASWMASLFIIPAALDSYAQVHHKKHSWFDGLVEWYKGFLTKALHNRYKVAGGLIVLFVVVVLLAQVCIGFVFLPTGGGKGVIIRTKMPQGTNVEANLKTMRQLEQLVMQLPTTERYAVNTHVGVEQTSLMDPAPSEGTHRGTIYLELTPEQGRKRTADQIIAALRVQVAQAQQDKTLDPRLKLDFRVDFDGPPIGLPVNVEIRGPELETLRVIAAEYLTYLQTVKGVYDVKLDMEEGKDEFRYKVNESLATRVGVSVADVAQTIFTAFNGMVITKVNQGDDEVGVRVRFPDSARTSFTGLQHVMIANPIGGLIPLSTVASYERQKGYAMINRLNYKRVAQVQANIDISKTTSKEVNKKLAKHFSQIAKKYPGYTVNLGGEEEDRQKSIKNLISSFVVALVIIYFVLVVFFRSLVVPIVVMSAVPFGIVGVNLALIVHRAPLTLMGLLGVFSVAGIVISNTLVLVQFITYLREQGKPLQEALIEGGTVRIRPILLTSGVTALGLLPAIYGLGGKDAFVDPLAMAFGYGLIFATGITLVLVPCFYAIAEDITTSVSKKTLIS